MSDLINRLREVSEDMATGKDIRRVAVDVYLNQAADALEAQAKEIADRFNESIDLTCKVAELETQVDQWKHSSDEFKRMCNQNLDTLAETIEERDTWKTRAEFSYNERSKLERRVEKLKALCDQLGEALKIEYRRNVDNYHGTSTQAKEALTAWRNPKVADNQFAAYDRAAKAMSPWRNSK